MEPKRPTGQGRHAPNPPSLYVPTVHMTNVALVDAGGQAKPGAQVPLQFAVTRPDALPYRPALQSVHTPMPPTLYVPAGHSIAVALVDPAGHAYPGLQLPLHIDDVALSVDPYRPAGQGAPTELAMPAPQYRPARAVHVPLHADDVSPVATPYGRVRRRPRCVQRRRCLAGT